MLDAGTHKARAKDYRFGRTSTGTEQVALLFEVTDGPCKGQLITWYGYFTDKTAERTFESLEYAGWGGKSLLDMSGLGSRECEIVVQHRESAEGREYAEVRWVNRLSSGTIAVKDEMNSAELAAFEKRMRGALLAWKQDRPQRGDSSSSRTASDDDIPF